MSYFVLVFNRALSAIVEREDYSAEQRELAWAAHHRLVRKYLETTDVEVVLLGSASEADLRATHGRYFEPALTS